MSSNTQTPLGTRLLAACEHAKLSQSQLAELVRTVTAAPVRQQQISQMESGQVQNSKYLWAIAKVLGVRAEWLRTGVGPMHDPLCNLSPDREELLKAAEDVPDLAVKEAVRFLRYLRRSVTDETA